MPPLCFQFIDFLFREKPVKPFPPFLAFERVCMYGAHGEFEARWFLTTFAHRSDRLPAGLLEQVHDLDGIPIMTIDM